MEREESGSFAVGAVMLVIGAALLVDRLGVLPWTAEWSVWPLLLIAFGVVNLVESPWRGARGVFPIALGLWLWAVEAGWIEFRDSWPVIFVLLGLAVMWQAWAAPADAALIDRRRRRERSPLVALAVIAVIFAATTIDARRYVVKSEKSEVVDLANRLHVFAALGDHEEHVGGETPFKGGEMVTLAGGSTLDLRDAVIPPGGEVTLDVRAMWGAVIVRVPPEWIVDVQTVPILGGVFDRRGTPESADTRIRVNGRPRGRAWGGAWTTGFGGPESAQAPATPHDAPGATLPAAPAASGKNPPAATPSGASDAARPRLVLTGSVLMGSLVLR